MFTTIKSPSLINTAETVGLTPNWVSKCRPDVFLHANKKDYDFFVTAPAHTSHPSTAVAPRRLSWRRCTRYDVGTIMTRVYYIILWSFFVYTFRTRNSSAAVHTWNNAFHYIYYICVVCTSHYALYDVNYLLYYYSCTFITLNMYYTRPLSRAKTSVVN